MMNATELHALAPYGARVDYFDGTAQPPDRHKNKLRAWRSRNDWGYFVMADPGDPTRPWSRPLFTLMRQNPGLITLVVKRIFDLDTDLQFEVTPPSPGTILAHSKHSRDRLEVTHVWPDWDAAYIWAMDGRYRLSDCGLQFLVVTEGGLQPATPPARGSTE